MEIEVVINVVRPSGHKINMHRWTLNVENGALQKRNLQKSFNTRKRHEGKGWIRMTSISFKSIDILPFCGVVKWSSQKRNQMKKKKTSKRTTKNSQLWSAPSFPFFSWSEKYV